MHKARTLLLILAGVLLTVPACSSGADDGDCAGDKCDVGNGPQFRRFVGAPVTACVTPPPGATAKGDFIDAQGRSCIPGILPPNDELAESYRDRTDSQGTHAGLNQNERDGLAAWILFSGKGTFLRQSTLDSEGHANALRFLDTSEVGRNTRFDKFGLLNDPGCTPATAPDEFGLMIDQCEDPYSAGVIGLRLKPNPSFDLEEWKALGEAVGGTGADGHFADASKTFDLQVRGQQVEKHGWEVEPPYLPSLTCGVCHAQPDPNNPPADQNNPQWDEVVFGLGNQYFKEGALLGGFFPDDDFVRELLHSQPPGTSDTSRVATDNIYNPNSINSIAHLGSRPLFIEDFPLTNSRGEPIHNPDRIDCAFRDDPVLAAQFPKDVGGLLQALVSGNDPRTPTGECVPTSRILKGGGDSSGPTGALLRVYVNVGACTDQMLEAAGGHFLESAAQRPISRQRLHTECTEYQDMEQRVIDTFMYLAYLKPYKLADAPNGNSFVDSNQIDRGKQVFAAECATCHSSTQPDDPGFDTDDPSTWFTQERISFFTDLVNQPDFPGNNYLSDERRYPVDLIGTNVARAYATNATRSHIWEEYGSATYQNQRTVPGAEVEVPLPFGLDFDFTLSDADDGRGYYRTPTLTNLWSSAPLLHNNGLGLYNGDPSVAGRIEAFEDAAEKMLFLRERDGKATIRRTTRRTKLMGVIPILEGWPIDTFGNLGLMFAKDTADTSFLESINPLNIVSRIRAHLGATDPIQDRGHEFGSDLSDQDKRALIEFLKTL